MKNALAYSPLDSRRNERRRFDTTETSLEPIELVIDLERQEIFHNGALAEWRAAVKLVHAEIAKIIRPGDVVMPRNPERVVVTMHGVPEAIAPRIARRLAVELNEIALNARTRLSAKVRVAQFANAA